LEGARTGQATAKLAVLGRLAVLVAFVLAVRYGCG